MNILFKGTKIGQKLAKIVQAKPELLLFQEYSHDFEYYDALSQTYDFSHVMTKVKPVNQ